MTWGCCNESESWYIRDCQFNLNYPMILTVPKIKPAFLRECPSGEAQVLKGNQFSCCRSAFLRLSSRSLIVSSQGKVRVVSLLQILQESLLADRRALSLWSRSRLH